MNPTAEELVGSLAFTTMGEEFPVVDERDAIRLVEQAYADGLRDGAAKEREVCAKVADEMRNDGYGYGIAAAIRARGEGV